MARDRFCAQALRVEALLAALALGEPDELAADALAAVTGVGDQHPGLALAGAQPLDTRRDDDDPVAEVSRSQLAC